ncbi:hypothetical protein [Nonomuraea sp. NPDC049158]|uniref:hypothetical protein n=1 Tax=Nonomuraea sp. NPDC049158 TaxID=3155649 RepID=UPI0033CB0E2E
MRQNSMTPEWEIDDFAKTWLLQHADGFRSGTLWLATKPPKTEVYEVAKIYRDLHDGGFSGTDSAYYDATHVPGFLDYLKGSPYEREVFDGVAEMADINTRQGTNFPAWPKEAFGVGFDDSFMLGFANACYVAVKMR